MKTLITVLLFLFLLFPNLLMAENTCDSTSMIHYQLKTFEPPHNLLSYYQYPNTPFFRQGDVLFLSKLEIRPGGRLCSNDNRYHNLTLYLISPEKERIPLCRPQFIDLTRFEGNRDIIIELNKLEQDYGKYNVYYESQPDQLMNHLFPNQCSYSLSSAGDWRIAVSLDDAKFPNFYKRISMSYTTTNNNFRIASYEEIENLELQKAIKFLAWAAIIISIVVGLFQVALVQRRELFFQKKLFMFIQFIDNILKSLLNCICLIKNEKRRGKKSAAKKKKK